MTNTTYNNLSAILSDISYKLDMEFLGRETYCYTNDESGCVASFVKVAFKCCPIMEEPAVEINGYLFDIDSYEWEHQLEAACNSGYQTKVVFWYWK